MKLSKPHHFRELKNSAWMIFEKILAFLGLILVTSYVAKYIGPTLLGHIALATAIFQIIQVIAQYGSDSIIFKRVSRSPASGANLIRASTRLRAVTYALLAIPVCVYLTRHHGTETKILIMATCAALFFAALDVYSIYNNAVLNSKFNAITNAIGLLCGLTLQLIVAGIELNPGFLFAPIIATTLIPYLLRRIRFNKSSQEISRWKRPARINKYLVVAGTSVALSSVAIALYTRVNQISVAEILGTTALGVYSVSITIALSWSFAITAIITSFFAKIYATRELEMAMFKAATLARYCLIISIAGCVTFYIVAEPLITMLYGNSFAGALLPSQILCASLVFSSLGTVSYRLIIWDGGFRFLAWKMLATLCVAVALSITLIPKFGLAGAAGAVLLVEIISATALNYFYKRGLVFRLHLRAIGIL